MLSECDNVFKCCEKKQYEPSPPYFNITNSGDQLLTINSFLQAFFVVDSLCIKYI